MSRLTRHVVLAAALGAAIALGLALAANLPATIEALRQFRWPLVPLILATVVTSWALRFLKWHLYLRRLTTDAALYGEASWHRERVWRFYEL